MTFVVYQSLLCARGWPKFKPTSFAAAVTKKFGGTRDAISLG